MSLKTLESTEMLGFGALDTKNNTIAIANSRKLNLTFIGYSNPVREQQTNAQRRRGNINTFKISSLEQESIVLIK